jgi:hypothetical protein
MLVLCGTPISTFTSLVVFDVISGLMRCYSPGSEPAMWEYRDTAIAWRCAMASISGATCLLLYLGDPNIMIGPGAALFWLSGNEPLSFPRMKQGLTTWRCVFFIDVSSGAATINNFARARRPWLRCPNVSRPEPQISRLLWGFPLCSDRGLDFYRPANFRGAFSSESEQQVKPVC